MPNGISASCIVIPLAPVELVVALNIPRVVALAIVGVNDPVGKLQCDQARRASPRWERSRAYGRAGRAWRYRCNTALAHPCVLAPLLSAGGPANSCLNFAAVSNQGSATTGSARHHSPARNTSTSFWWRSGILK